MSHEQHLQAVNALCDKLRPIIATHLHVPQNVTPQETHTIVSMAIASLLAEVFAVAEQRRLTAAEHRDFTLAIGAACREWMAKPAS